MRLTDKGREMVETIWKRFQAGESIEAIAASIDPELDVEHIQLLIAIYDHQYGDT